MTYWEPRRSEDIPDRQLSNCRLGEKHVVGIRFA